MMGRVISNRKASACMFLIIYFFQRKNICTKRGERKWKKEKVKE